MSAEQPIAGYDLAGGRYTLFADRLVFTGADASETVPLAHLASVRVAFGRDASKLAWAIALVAAALFLGSLSAPLASWMQALQAKVPAGGTGESLESALAASFSALARLARLFVPVAWALAAGAAAPLFFYWRGRTTLTLAFAATERACAVRGRDSRLIDFAELLAGQLAGRKG